LSLQVRPKDLTSETPKIDVAVRAELLHRVRAKHSVAFELRLGEKLVSGALVPECFAPLKVFVDVARLIAVTRRLDVNDDAIGSGGTVDCGIANATNGAVTALLFRSADLAAGINANTAVGAGALFSNTDGASNNSVGFNALGSNVDGLFNNVMGFDAMADNVSGAGNVAVGDSAGAGVEGDFNIYTGAFAGPAPSPTPVAESETIRIGDVFNTACLSAASGVKPRAVAWLFSLMGTASWAR
jgi:hypothetical protein